MIPFRHAWEQFQLRCESKNLTAGTISWYDQILRALATFLETRGVTALEAIEPGHLRAYVAELKRRGLSSQTIFGTCRALRCAFRFWTREYKLSADPMEQVELPRRERPLIRPLTAEQAGRLLSVTDPDRWDGVRDQAIMMLLLDTGLRLSELLSLEAGRIDWTNRSLTVMGKGRKERIVPFSERTAQAMRDYDAFRARRPVHAPQFFLGRTGKQICRSKVRRLIVRYGRRARIEGVRLSPHTLRHTFAVLYIKNGGDSFSLQQILGHSTLEMTRRYVHLASRDVAEQHARFSPVGGLGST